MTWRDRTDLFADEAAQSALVRSAIHPKGVILITPCKLTPEFLDAVNPQFVVFFAGPTARDQPSADLLAALSDVTLLRTDERGTVEVVVAAEGVGMRTDK